MSAEAAASDSEDEVHDWRALGNLALRTKQVDAAVLKRGDKDHSPDGTNSQQDALKASRDAMYTALSAPRGHAAKSVLIGEWNVDVGKAQVTQTRGNYLNTMGTADRHGVHWLLPEETIYLVQRGSMLCYYNGHPLSVQGIMALCLPDVGSLEKLTVFSYLKKLGYIVRRPHRIDLSPIHTGTPKSHWSQIFRPLASASLRLYLAFLNRPQLAWRRSYPNFTAIYHDLRLVKSGRIPDYPTETCDFYAWRPATKFKKSVPGEPEFRIYVAKGGDKMPTHDHLAKILGGSPEHESTKRSVLSRMREGRRRAIVAVVDSGIIAFVRMAEPNIEPIKPVVD